MMRIPPAASRRFLSLPARLRLSRPKTSASGIASRICIARALPTNPQIPVIKIFTRKNHRTKAGKPRGQNSEVQESRSYRSQKADKMLVPYALETSKPRKGDSPQRRRGRKGGNGFEFGVRLMA